MPVRIETVDVILPLAVSEDAAARSQAAARQLGIAPNRIGEIRLRKHSIDARKRDIKIQLRLEVAIDGKLPPETLPTPAYPTVPANAKRVIIIGSGPAGLFAALRLIERGVKPIVLERGKDASARRFDLAPILR